MKFTLSMETMNELETFSAKIEVLRNYVDFVNDFVWQKIAEGYEGEAADKIGMLTETLSTVTHARDKELEEIVLKIKPLA